MSNSNPCTVCKELETIPEGGICCIKLSENLFEDTVSDKKTIKKQEIHTFCKHINAFLNNGSGVAFAHTESPHLLVLFKEVIVTKLSSLISDNSCYTDNFEIIFLDEKHVLFRVKPVKTCFFSFLSFNTKLSVDKGVADPTHGQFFYLLRFLESAEEQTNSKIKRQLLFQSNNCLKILQEITNSNGTKTSHVVFHEGVGIEAKSFVGLTLSGKKDKIDVLFPYIWKSCGLPRYISAFSKFADGGSVYFGVREEKRSKESKRKWCRQDKSALSNRLLVQDESLHVWKSQNPKQTNVFLVAEKNEVEAEIAAPEHATGKFLYEEKLSLTKDEQERLREKIRQAASELYVYPPKDPLHQEAMQPDPGTPSPGAITRTPVKGATPHNPGSHAMEKELIKVEFHKTPNPNTTGEANYIVEVVIARFPGLVFSVTDGPESYTLDNNELVPVPAEESIKRAKRRRVESI